MFVRFRQSKNRLQASLIETRRVDGKVRHEHIAGLGSVDAPPSVRGRLLFWAKIPDRLRRLSNRAGQDDLVKIYEALDARIPLVTPDEQQALQIEVAEGDAKQWGALEDHFADMAASHGVMAEGAKKASELAKESASEANAQAEEARIRIEKLKAGESVEGGLFNKPMDVAKLIGWTKSDLQHARRLGVIEEAGMTDEFIEMMLSSSRKEKSASRKMALRILRERRGLSGS